MTEAIQVYARVRPCTDQSDDFPDVKIDEVDSTFLRIDLPPGMTQANIAQEVHYRFPFQYIFWKDSLQEDLFNIIAVPLINHALEGYNATLFAYGQTGSGKTFTITGDGTPNCMGIVPRAIQYVYSHIPEYSDFETSISYLEIYNNNAYDLLTPQPNEGASITKLEDLRKVQIVDTGKETICKGLSCENAPDIESAHLHFWAGESARQKAATVNNKYSSRSHTIFTFYFKFTKNVPVAGDDSITAPVIIQSKINFVDLAGSEKYTSLSDEVNERKLEARHINKSLSTLQSVILGITGKKSHIPFRDSVLTRFLKDSLIGNVKTAMISTLSTNRKNLSETVSTCRFAESVARVTTTSKINQRELPPHEMITRLRAEIASLRQSIQRASGSFNNNSQIALTSSSSIDNLQEKPSTDLSNLPLSRTTTSSGEIPKVRQISDVEAVELKKQVISFVENQTNHLDAYAPEQSQFCFQFMKEMIRRGNSSTLTVSKLQEKVDDNQKNMDNLLSLLSARQVNQSSGKPLVAKQSAYLEFCINHEKYPDLKEMKLELRQMNREAQSVFQDFKMYQQQRNEIQEQLDIALKNRNFDHEEDEDEDEELKIIEDRLNGVTQLYSKTLDDLKQVRDRIQWLDRDARQLQDEIHDQFEKFWVDVVMAHSSQRSTNQETPVQSPAKESIQSRIDKSPSSAKSKKKKMQAPVTTDPRRLRPF